MRHLVCLLTLLWLAGMAGAKAPDTSLRPVARPATVDVETVAAADFAGPRVSATRPVARPVRTQRRAAVSPEPRQNAARQDRPGARPLARPDDRITRPKLRPSGLAVRRATVQSAVDDRTAGGAGANTAAVQVAQPVQKETRRKGLFQSLRPLLRPRAVGQRGIARKNQLARGAVCGDLAIQGTEVGPVRGTLNGCGVIKAVKVREVSGVQLSQHSLMDCVTAKALKRWINAGMKPAVGNTGGGVRQIRVAAHYSCRTRNNQPGAKISEHGRGRAIDISGFVLNDGTVITLLADWRDPRKGRILRSMHKSACGAFGTVLGPNANRYHLDHFHFDTARYRSGSYCR